MIRAIIFDVDGVLLDSMPVWHSLGRRYIRRQKVSVDKSIDDILFSMSMEQGAEYIRENYLPDMTAEEIQHGFEKMIEDEYFHKIPLKAGAREFLQLAKDNKITVIAATSSPRVHIEKALKRLKILSFFKAVITSTEVGSSKHSPEIYLKAVEITGTKPEETLVIEDSLYALKTAKKAGFVTLGVYDPNGEPNQSELEEVADYYAKSSEKTINILRLLLM